MNVLNQDVELTWLGHATWLVRTPEGKRLLIDPFIQGNPKCPAEYKRDDAFDGIDGILCTHGHGDHISDLVPIAKRTGATVVAIFDLTTWAESKGVEATNGGNKGGTLSIADVEVTLVQALHSSSYMDGDVNVDMGDPCGLVLRFSNGFTIYNAGDTDVFGDMALIAELYAPDLVILPIGDHFTMGPRQAAKAVSLLKAKRVVPQHYGTFPLLTGTPEALQALLPDDVELLTLEVGETLS